MKALTVGVLGYRQIHRLAEKSQRFQSICYAQNYIYFYVQGHEEERTGDNTNLKKYIFSGLVVLISSSHSDIHIDNLFSEKERVKT